MMFPCELGLRPRIEYMYVQHKCSFKQIDINFDTYTVLIIKNVYLRSDIFGGPCMPIL
jgi:hypothetical protein